MVEPLQLKVSFVLVVIIVAVDKDCTPDIARSAQEEKASFVLLWIGIKYNLAAVLSDLFLITGLFKHAGTEETHLHDVLLTFRQRPCVLAAVNFYGKYVKQITLVLYSLDELINC